MFVFNARACLIAAGNDPKREGLLPSRVSLSGLENWWPPSNDQPSAWARTAEHRYRENGLLNEGAHSVREGQKLPWASGASLDAFVEHDLAKSISAAAGCTQSL